MILVNSVTRPARVPAPDQSYLVVQRLHELQRQDHPGDPLDELLLERHRPRGRDGRPHLLGRLDREGEGRARRLSRTPLAAASATNGDPLRDHAERGPPADGHGHDRRRLARPTTSTSPAPPPRRPPSRRARPTPAPGCTDPERRRSRPRWTRTAGARSARRRLFQSYPARKGPDQFYGYGRVNMAKALTAVLPTSRTPPASRIPPEAEITSPEWYRSRSTRPSRRSTSQGQVFARGAAYTCDVFVAPGQYPNNAPHDGQPAGRLRAGLATAGATARPARRDHSRLARARLDLGAAEVALPAAATDFTGRRAAGRAPTNATAGPTPPRTRSRSRWSSRTTQRRPR